MIYWLCIRLAYDGKVALSIEARDIMFRPGLDMPSGIPELTKREKQILQLLASGKTSAEIAEELFISPLTVKTHRATLLQKFDVSNLVTLIKSAKDYGMI